MSLLLQPVIMIPLVAFASYIVAVVLIAQHVGAWNPALIKDTGAWFFVSGLVLFFDVNKAAEEEGYFRRKARAAFGIFVVLAVYINVETFALPIEFGLQFLLLVLIFVSMFGAREPALAAAKQAADRLLAVLGLIFLAYVTVRLAVNIHNADIGHILLSLTLPVWLTLAALPASFVLTLYMTYDAALRHLRLHAPDRRPNWRVKLAVVFGYRFRIRDLRRSANYWAREAANANSVRAALAVIAEHCASLRANENEKRKRADDLVFFAGVDGEDEAGRRLDRREFAETIDALEWLSTCYMGWYRNRTKRRYHRDLLKKILQPPYTRRLPEQHGIRTKVRRDGQAWFAWRHTVSGWVFAIGANGPPPNQWFYDGSKPPKGYPAVDATWGDRPFVRSDNWDDPALV